MQLNNRPNSLRGSLALATSALLCGTAHAQSGSDWRIDSSVLFYSEADRVNIVEPVLFATNQLGEEESMTVKVVYDTLSGASPNGASITDKVQTFTAPSGNAFDVAAGELPKLAFRDTRVALGFDWDARPEPLLRRTVGLNFSKESDYLSLGGSVNYARDFNQKLSTLAVGLGVALDRVQPTGGVPIGLTQVVPAANEKPRAATVTGASGGGGGSSSISLGFGEDEEGLSGEPKNTIDVMVGLTQVLSRRTLMQVNLSRSSTTGYLTDPYKVLSVVDPGTGITSSYVYEKRPDTRNANIFYTHLAHHLEEDVVHLSYRYFTDDWGVRSHTTEVTYRWKLGEEIYIEPQFRYYSQTAADFYRHSIVAGQDIGDYASADLRLGKMASTMTGLKIGTQIGDGELSARFAQLRETGTSHPGDAVGIQKQVDLYPALDVTMVNLSYSTTW